MLGNEYLFEGNYIGKKTLPLKKHLVLDVKMTDVFLKDKERKCKYPCFSLRIDFFGKKRWTNPIPIKS